MNKLILFLLISLSFLYSNSVLSQSNANLDLAVQYYNNKEYEKAAKLFDELNNKQPSSNYYTFLIRCYIELSEFDKAEKAIQKQIKKFPQSPQYMVDLGYILTLSNKVKQGRKIYDNLISNVKPDINAINYLASLFRGKRENEYAIKTYKKGNELLKGSYDFGIELANIYDFNGNILGAIEEYIALLEKNASNKIVVLGYLQDIINRDVDGNASEAMRILLLEKSQKSPNNTLFSEMLLWYYTQSLDFDLAYIHARALDKRLGIEDENRVLTLGKTALSNNKYEFAKTAFKYVVNNNNKWANIANTELVNTDFEILKNNYPINIKEAEKLEKEYYKVIDIQNNIINKFGLIDKLSELQAYYLNKTDSAVNNLSKIIEMSNGNKMYQSEIKLKLADIFLFTNEPWEATLLYSQVDKDFKAEPIGHEARLKNAKLSFYIGEMGWALSQLDVLKAATSKLIANDAMALSLTITDNIEVDSNYTPLIIFAQADLLNFQKKTHEALLTLDSLQKKFPFHSIVDDILFKKAEINEKIGNYEKAIELFTKIITSYPSEVLADKALFKIAEINEKTGNYEKALEAYQRILIDYPGSIYTIDARKKIRIIRGDKL